MKHSGKKITKRYIDRVRNNFTNAEEKFEILSFEKNANNFQRSYITLDTKDGVGIISVELVYLYTRTRFRIRLQRYATGFIERTISPVQGLRITDSISTVPLVAVSFCGLPRVSIGTKPNAAAISFFLSSCPSFLETNKIALQHVMPLGTVLVRLPLGRGTMIFDIAQYNSKSGSLSVRQSTQYLCESKDLTCTQFIHVIFFVQHLIL